MTLLGRQAECEALDRLVTDALAGRSGVVVLRGEPGVGKTALLEHVATRAEGWHVARASGVESEMELAYSGLHQLCGPMLEHIERLPGPQRDALATVFGSREGAAPDRFLVGLATLTLFSEVAEQRPLLCIVDDVHWLDQASSQILGFVARRLLAERLAMVCVARAGIGDGVLEGLPAISVEGLSERDARALLLSSMPGPLDTALCDRIVMESHGNPLAVLELPRTLDATELAVGLPSDQPVAGKIELSYARRLRELPSETQMLAVAAAAEPLGDPVVLYRAAGTLGIEMSAAEPARQAGLLTLSERVTFAHPLARSAAYRSASADDRRRVHRALAEATDAGVDPDRRAWHLAASAEGPDERVAVELERSAARAQSRGGLAAEAAFLQRAVALTDDPSRRTARAVAAARASLAAGAFEAAHGSLATAAAGPLDELQEAQVGLLRAELAFAESRGSDAPPLLLDAARRLESLDARLARDTYLEAWGAALFAGRLAGAGGTTLDVSRAASTAPGPADPPRASDLLLDGLAQFLTEGRATAEPVLRRALSAYMSDEVRDDEMLRWGWLATRAANLVWDQDSALEIGRRAMQLARDLGALEVLAVVDNAYGQACAFAGDFSTAGVLAAEVDAVKEATGSRIASHARLALAGLRGQEEEATPLIEAIVRNASAAGQGAALQYARWANAVLMNGLGRYEVALASAIEAGEDAPETHIAMWAQSEVVEAATRTGNADLAQGGLGRLRAQTDASEADWGLGMLARSRALASDGEDAERCYLEALERLGRTRLRPELARSHLLYGEWLRRQGRRVDAREHLRTAHEMLATMGMMAFAERARHELLATGEKVRTRGDETREQLTPQEEQIARLARDGLSNPEIGAQLFISARTVEWHLSKVFTKLDIASRKQLRVALPDTAQGNTPRGAMT